MTEADFLELITRNRARLIRICRFYCREQADREDLFQEMVYQGWRSLPSFKGHAKPDTWLYRLALNTALTSHRKAQRRPQAQTDELERKAPMISPDWEADLDKQAQLRWLYERIHALTEPDRTLLLLFLEEMPYAEIAELTGLSVNLVGVRLNRAKKKLSTLAQQTFTT